MSNKIVSEYQDASSMWHDKKTKNGKPSSGNAFIYSAYAKALKLPLDMGLVQERYSQCVVKVKRGEININRHPGKTRPPFSFDEILGCYYLGLIDYDTLKANHFVFKGRGKKMSTRVIKKALEGIAELAIRKAMGFKVDRNTFWKRKVTRLDQMAYRINPGQVWFFKKHAGANIHKEDEVFRDLYVECTLKNGSEGEKNVLWLLSKMARKRSIMKKCKPERNFKKYFGKAHPFGKVKL